MQVGGGCRRLHDGGGGVIVVDVTGAGHRRCHACGIRSRR